MPPTPGRSRCCPDRRAPFAGWERADSIVVNPHKWLFTPLDASLLLTRRMDVLRAAFSLVPEYLRTLDRDDARSATTTSTRRSSGAGSGRSSCGSSCAGSVSKGCVAGSTRTSAMAAAFAALGRRGPGLGAAGARPVLDGLLPLATRGPRPVGRGGARRRERGDHGRGQSDRRGLPLAHPAAPAGSRSAWRSATCGRSRATSSGPGRCCARRPRHGEHGAARRPVLRDARASCATGSTPTTRPPTSCGSATTRRRSGRPSVDWSQAVDEALCVGWIDGVRKQPRRARSASSGSRRAARAATGAPSTSPRSRR